jgi:hypothetical protein
MSKAFVDTTILTDALLKPGTKAEAAKTALRRYQRTLLPVYAIKEFKAGPLRYFRWLHNKCAVFKSYAAVLGALHGISRTPQRYLTSTAIEALQLFATQWKDVTPTALSKKYGHDADMDFVLSDSLRLSIRTQIDLAWDERREITTEIVDELDCYVEAAPYLDEKGLMALMPNACEPDRECALAKALKENPEALKRLHAAVPESGRREDQKRARILKDLYRVPKQPLDRENCRALGDAIFAFFCPADSVILTTNLRDHKPLAEALGKEVHTPSDSVPGSS